jgi:hypothetical protein
VTRSVRSAARDSQASCHPGRGPDSREGGGFAPGPEAAPVLEVPAHGLAAGVHPRRGVSVPVTTVVPEARPLESGRPHGMASALRMAADWEHVWGGRTFRKSRHTGDSCYPTSHTQAWGVSAGVCTCACACMRGPTWRVRRRTMVCRPSGTRECTWRRASSLSLPRQTRPRPFRALRLRACACQVATQDGGRQGAWRGLLCGLRRAGTAPKVPPACPGGCCPLPVFACPHTCVSGSPLQNKRISKGKGGKGGKRKTCVATHTCSRGRPPCSAGLLSATPSPGQQATAAAALTRGCSGAPAGA